MALAGGLNSPPSGLSQSSKKPIFVIGWRYNDLRHCPDGYEFLYKIQNAKGDKMFQTLTRVIKTTLAPAIAALTILLSPSIGNSTVFTSEAAFQTAAGAYALENFDGLGPHGTSYSTLSSLGVDLLPLNNGADPRVVSPGIIGGFAHSGSFVLTNNSNDLLPANGPLNIVPINGMEVITAVGLWNVSNDDVIGITFFDELDAIMETTIINGGFPLFGGIINTAGAARVEIALAGVGNGWITIDDLQVTLDTSAIPEPAPFGVMALGLVSLAINRRRRAKLAA